MAINPYQSPALNIAGIDDVSDVASHGERDAVEIRWTLRALHLIRLGDAVQSIATGMFGILLLVNTPSAKTLSTLQATVTFGVIGTGGLFSFIGLVLLTSQAHRQQTIAILALLLQTIGTVAVASFVASIRRSQFIGGLLPLFGAAAFAMLLTSRAIVALVVRARTPSQYPTRAVGWSHLAVICYAACATLASALSLRAIPVGMPTTFALLLIFIFGLVATIFRLCESNQVITNLDSHKVLSLPGQQHH